MKWNLQSVGIPLIYRTMNPFALSDEERLDAYPTRANPRGVNIWMSLTGNKFALPGLAWETMLHAFVVACEKKGQPPFVLDGARRNADEEVRNFLTPRRRRVRDYLDPSGLLTLPIFRTTHKYTRNENSWWVRSQARIIKKIDGIAIGQDLHKREHWIRTHCPEYKGSQSWHKWIQPGVTRVGWSTSGTESWLWYEIRCPHMPGITGHYRNLDDAAFTKHLDTIWLPLIRNIRWWSTSNVRTWTL